MPKLVRKTYSSPQKITPAQRRELEKLAAMPDSEIDFSDIPETTAEDWKNARRFSEVMAELRRTVTVKLDPDVAEWLKKQPGRDVSDTVNKLLRSLMRT